MPSVVYRPAEVLQWFGMGSRRSRSLAVKRGHAALQGSSFVQGLRQVAGAAADYSKVAIGDMLQKRAEEVSYVLSDTALESHSSGSTKRIPYTDVVSIEARPHDRFDVLHKAGKLVIRPVAHLVAGRVRVPVGWVRNGLEVPYSMLVEELAAHCSLDVKSE